MYGGGDPLTPSPVLACASPAALHAGSPMPARRGRAGFTLIEVLIALAMLLVGGVGILAVFAVAAAHLVESKVAERLAQVRFEAETMAQEAVDAMKPDAKQPEKIDERKTTVPGYTVSVEFAKSPNDDPAYVAKIRISYRGTPTPHGLLPPKFLTRSTIDPDRSRR
jgi:prepilin-type N-terminal cleavage/methylation domain-containing protein